MAPCTMRAVASSERIGDRPRAITGESCAEAVAHRSGRWLPAGEQQAEDPHVKATGLEECHAQTFPEPGRGEALRPRGQLVNGDRKVRHADRRPVAVESGQLDLLRHCRAVQVVKDGSIQPSAAHSRVDVRSRIGQSQPCGFGGQPTVQPLQESLCSFEEGGGGGSDLDHLGDGRLVPHGDSLQRYGIRSTRSSEEIGAHDRPEPLAH